MECCLNIPLVRIRRAEHSNRTRLRNVRIGEDSSSQLQNVRHEDSVSWTARPPSATPSRGKRNVRVVMVT